MSKKLTKKKENDTSPMNGVAQAISCLLSKSQWLLNEACHLCFPFSTPNWLLVPTQKKKKNGKSKISKINFVRLQNREKWRKFSHKS